MFRATLSPPYEVNKEGQRAKKSSVKLAGLRGQTDGKKKKPPPGPLYETACPLPKE
jgi:hypothetical protein